VRVRRRLRVSAEPWACPSRSSSLLSSRSSALWRSARRHASRVREGPRPVAGLGSFTRYPPVGRPLLLLLLLLFLSSSSSPPWAAVGGARLPSPQEDPNALRLCRESPSLRPLSWIVNDLSDTQLPGARPLCNLKILSALTARAALSL
jgi:hypothetical protein